MIKQKILAILQNLTNHDYIEITTRGNKAIESALSVIDGEILIPEEGGWLTYRDLPKKLNLSVEEVKCNGAKIDLNDLRLKLQTKEYSAFLYQNPGGYFAKQPMEEIYSICSEHGCLVIIDVSGAIGTELCSGNYADILVGSFGKWKLVEARIGGFISCRDENLFNKLIVEKLEDGEKLEIINGKFNELQNRINFLTEKRKNIIEDLSGLDIVHRNDLGFVVVVKFSTDEEREILINYCENNNLEWTECPRYIRLNKKAISIEVKRL